MVEVLYQTTGHVLTTCTDPTFINAFGNVSLESKTPYVHKRTRAYGTALRNRNSSGNGLVRLLDRDQRTPKIILRWLFTLIIVNLPDASIVLPISYPKKNIPQVKLPASPCSHKAHPGLRFPPKSAVF